MWGSLTFTHEVNVYAKGGYDHSAGWWSSAAFNLAGLTSNGMNVSKSYWDFLLQVSVKIPFLILLAWPWLHTQERHLHFVIGGWFPMLLVPRNFAIFFCNLDGKWYFVFFFCDCCFHSPSPGMYLGEFVHLNEIMQGGGVAQRKGESGKKLYKLPEITCKPCFFL